MRAVTASRPTSGASRATRSFTRTRRRQRDGTASIPERRKEKATFQNAWKGQTGYLLPRPTILKAFPDSVSAYFPKPLVSLGTDGFGRSDTREALRDFFEVDYRHIAIAALHELAREGRIDEETVSEAISEFGIDRGKPNPAVT